MKFYKAFYLYLIFLQLVSCSKSDHGGNGETHPLPEISAITPNNAHAGSSSITLTVIGNNFINGSIVKWNAVSLLTTFNSNTKLTAVIPALELSTATTASVTVFSPSPGGGTSSAITFQITANNLQPVIDNISPATVQPGAGAFTLTVSGANFINGSVINWNNSSLTTSFISSFQLTALVPATDISTMGTATITVTNPTPIGAMSNSFPLIITSATTVKRFLFDAAHAETAGNADWVIDEDNNVPQRFSTPAQSNVTSTTNEDYWTGAISSWGIALVKLNNIVETLPAGTSITYGNSSNAQDLANYDVFIVDEPNKVFSAAEKTAIMNFVNNGGGLLMISDHTMSDRDGDGWDSPAIWNDFMTNNSVQNNPFGFSIDLSNFSEISSNLLSGTGNTILNGSQGTVTQVQFNNGTSATINPAINPNVQGLLWKSSSSHNNNNIMSLTSTYGTGRIFFLGDSSPTDDGTGDPSNILYGGWLNYSHKSLFLNASLWLAKL